MSATGLLGKRVEAMRDGISTTVSSDTLIWKIQPYATHPN